MRTEHKQNLLAAVLVSVLALPALAQTDASFYHPLTLAAAAEPAGGGGGAPAKADEIQGAPERGRVGQERAESRGQHH